jgi:hypothetical protein
MNRFYEVPLSDILFPKPNRICYQESWWIVTKDRNVLFFKPNHTSPQCNTNKNMVEHWLRGNPEFKDCTVELLPIVYLNHKCSDYV